MGAFAAPLAIAGGLVSAFSSIQQGNYQAAVARNNAIIARQNAAETSQSSQEQAKREDEQNAVLLAEQIAAQGASGLDIASRSFSEGRALTEASGRLEALDITRKGTSAARQLLQDAANYRAAGKQAKLQGYLNAAGTLLNTASDAAGGKFGNLGSAASGVKASLIGGKRKSYPWDKTPNWFGNG